MQKYMMDDDNDEKDEQEVEALCSIRREEKEEGMAGGMKGVKIKQQQHGIGGRRPPPSHRTSVVGDGKQLKFSTGLLVAFDAT